MTLEDKYREGTPDSPPTPETVEDNEEERPKFITASQYDPKPVSGTRQDVDEPELNLVPDRQDAQKGWIHLGRSTVLT